MAETRKGKSWKQEFLELEKKYNALLEVKVGFNNNTPKENSDAGKVPAIPKDDGVKKEVVEAPKPAEATLDNQAPKELPKGKEKTLEPQSEENLTSPQSVEEFEEPEEENLEIEKEPEQPSEDYDYCCSECKELFNEAGNKEGDAIKCPSCGEVF